MKLPRKIESERIILKNPIKPTFNLAKKLYKIIDESRNTLQEWFPWPDKTNSPEDEFTFYLVNLCQKKWNEGTAFGYLIYKKGSKEILGNINLCSVDEKNQSAEIGYWLSDSATGYGYMQEAIRALEDKAFHAGINRIVIKNDTKNIRSIHVAERCGYTLEGVMRQDAWDYFHKHLRDTNVWSKLKSEWKKIK